MKEITQTSPAKLNLFLNITGKNQYDYHLLQSLFIVLDLHDTLILNASDHISCQLYNAEIHEENLVCKAARLLQTRFAIQTGAQFTLHKNIPIGSGLGGGSSNAATAIKMLNDHWNLGLDIPNMLELGSQIGADVPFFIYQQHAFVEGIGEIIKPVHLKQKLFLLLIHPNFPCHTAQIFKARNNDFSNKLNDNSNDTIIHEIHHGKNDLQSAAISLHPTLQNILSLIETQDGCQFSRLSGSGSTCFGLFNDIHSLTKAQSNIKLNHPQLWSYSQELEV